MQAGLESRAQSGEERPRARPITPAMLLLPGREPGWFPSHVTNSSVGIQEGSLTAAWRKAEKKQLVPMESSKGLVENDQAPSPLVSVECLEPTWFVCTWTSQLHPSGLCAVMYDVCSREGIQGWEADLKPS